ncbi:MAG: hypothetical protein KY453_09115, partial [Gemmatimonadetes bacterium]|nr:hypothetical protein [Gemmatimonadota bacterium]
TLGAQIDYRNGYYFATAPGRLRGTEIRFPTVSVMGTENAMLAATLEWRYEVWFHPGDAHLRAEGFAFVDHGGVGPTLDRVDTFETTPGLGLRFIDRGVSLVEVYAAWGGDRSPRFDIELGATF